MAQGAIGYRQLRAFHAVFETGSMTAAAKMLGITQPAVSNLLSRLEQDTGLQLFVREGATLRPSTDARALQASVAHLVVDFRNVQSTLQALRRGTGGQLLISSQPLVGLSVLPSLVAAFRRERPGVVVRLHTTTSTAVGSSLWRGMHDIGIAALPLDTASARIRTFRAPCVAILPKAHPLAEKELISPELLHGLPFVSMMPERFMYHLVQQAFDAAGARLNVVCEADFFAVAAGIVANGDCVSVVDPFTAAQFGHEVVARPFVPRIDYEFAIYRSPERELTPVAQHFVDMFCAAMDERLTRPAISMLSGGQE